MNKIRYMGMVACVGLLLLGSGCSTPKDVAYFQDLEEGSVLGGGGQTSIRVAPEDKLMILVNTQDPALSSLFNLVQTQTRVGTSTSTTSQVGEMGSSGSNSYQVSYYTVNPSGDIDFPVLGEIHVAGMTRSEVAAHIRGLLVREDLVKDPVVTVEFANTGITVLGEVARPGRFEFNKDHMTVLDALGMAGDLTISGERTGVLVLRAGEDGVRRAHVIDLTDAGSLASSPVFYLRQDDVVYVTPNDKKKRETTASGNTMYTPSFWITVGSLGVTVATLIATLAK